MKKIIKKDLNNTFVIGDVHGCYHTLLKLVQKLPLDAQLIFVGDLCDKGNFSKDVIEFVIQNNYTCVKGNHEYLFEKHILDVVENGNSSLWSDDKRVGGGVCIQSYKNDLVLIKKHLAWISDLPTYLEIENYFITHAFALELYKNRDKQEYQKDLFLKRYYEDTIEPSIDEDIINVFGHCVFDEVQVGEKFFCLDTGCFRGGSLSALCIGTHEVIQEVMDTRDSSYSVRELTLDLFKTNSTLVEIREITLSGSCVYVEYDVISHEVLAHIVEIHKEKGVEELKEMQRRAVIFPKQINRILEAL